MSDEIIQADFNSCDDLLCSEEGRGDFIKDNIERLSVWKESAEAGDARGQLLYGLCFFYGHGVEEDEDVAIEWFLKSAEQGNAQAQCSLGLCFLHGFGVKENSFTANVWLKKAAAQKHQGAIEKLPRLAKIELGLEPHTVLTKEMAEQFLADEDSVDLSEFTAIDDDAAEMLAQGEGGELNLSSVVSVSDAVAQDLSNFEGSLVLDGLANLSEAAAKNLSNHSGSLLLNGLASLSETISKSLSTHNGELQLNGLRQLADAVAESLSEYQGDLHLSGLPTLSESASLRLGKFKGKSILLDGLETIPDQVASNLSSVANLHLPCFTNLVHCKRDGQEISGKVLARVQEQEAIDEFIGNVDTVGGILCSTHNDEHGHNLYDAISRFKIMMTIARNGGHINGSIAEELLELEEDYLESDEGDRITCPPLSDPYSSLLKYCTSLDEDAANAFLRLPGTLYLDSLTKLTDEAAEILIKHEGELSIELDGIPESAAAILRKHPSFAESEDDDEGHADED